MPRNHKKSISRKVSIGAVQNEARRLLREAQERNPANTEACALVSRVLRKAIHFIDSEKVGQ